MGDIIEVYATTDHPASSRAHAVWVDNNGQAYCQVDLPNPVYEVVEEWEEQTPDEVIADIIAMTKTLREAQGVSKYRLARDGVFSAESQVTALEEGRSIPKLKTLVSYLDYLGYTLQVVPKIPKS